jgi:hypothetical protein
MVHISTLTSIMNQTSWVSWHGVVVYFKGGVYSKAVLVQVILKRKNNELPTVKIILAQKNLFLVTNNLQDF